jgi:hypothetical protein
MIKYLLLFIIILNFSIGSVQAQTIISTADLFKRTDNNSRAGQLNIIQDPALDTLINRHILANMKRYKIDEHYGMDGFRIQVYNSSNRNAREESGKARADFMIKFPDIVSYPLYENPGYFKVRVGDFRTRTEAINLFLIISKEFPNAYIVPDIINFPDLNTK